MFVMQTHQGTRLSLDSGARRLTQTGAEAVVTATPLVFLAPDAMRPRCLAFGFDADGQPLIPLNHDSQRPMLFLINAEDSGVVTLRDAQTNMFVCVLPHGHGDVETNRAAVSSWERFWPLRLRQDGFDLSHLPANLLDDTVAALSAGHPWPTVLRTLLGMTACRWVGDLVEAIWPLLTIDEFDAFALDMRQDGESLQRLAGLFPLDYWATQALPALVASQRGAGAAPEALSWRRRVIGPERDHLAVDGWGGRLASIGHACNAALRLHSQPRRGTAVVTTARSEGIYLLEWIAYHRLIGVEAFFVYSNNNDDGSDELLAALDQAGVIHWVDNRVSPGTPAQTKAYGHALNVEPALLDYRWALVIDLDEFLVLNPDRYRHVGDFARESERRQTDAVALNWVFVTSFGDANWDELPLTRRNMQAEKGVNPHVKTLLSPRHFIQSQPHYPFADERRGFIYRVADGSRHESRRQAADAHHRPAFSDQPSDEHACIYHYYHKSLDEFLWKCSRNRGDFPMSEAITFESMDRHSARWFLDQNTAGDTRPTERIHRCAPGLEAEIERLRDLAYVREAEAAVRVAFAARLAVVKDEFLRSQKLQDLEELGVALQELVQRADH